MFVRRVCAAAPYVHMIECKALVGNVKNKIMR